MKKQIRELDNRDPMTTEVVLDDGTRVCVDRKTAKKLLESFDQVFDGVSLEKALSIHQLEYYEKLGERIEGIESDLKKIEHGFWNGVPSKIGTNEYLQGQCAVVLAFLIQNVRTAEVQIQEIVRMLEDKLAEIKEAEE